MYDKETLETLDHLCDRLTSKVMLLSMMIRRVRAGLVLEPPEGATEIIKALAANIGNATVDLMDMVCPEAGAQADTELEHTVQ